MNWQTLVVVAILFLGAGVSGRLFLFVWGRRNFPGAAPFSMLAAALVIWALGYGAELLVPSLEAKTLCSQVEYIGISLTPAAWLLFALSYTRRDEWLTRPRLALILTIPVITIGMAFTNHWHGLLWASYMLDADGPLQVFKVSAYGPWWMLHFGYSYLMLFFGTLALFLTLRSYSRLYQGQFAILLLSLALPWVANILYLSRLNPLPQLDLSPFAFILSMLLIWQSLYRFHWFDLAPVGSTPVLDRLDSAALVLDGRNRLVDANQVACDWFNLRYEQVLGQPVAQALREWQQIDLNVAGALEINQKISLVVAGVKRFYVLQISPIWNRRRLTGRLVLLRDITSDQLTKEALSLAHVKTEFLAKVSHELRTPLTSILGVAEMLEYGIYGPLSKEQKKALGVIFDSTSRMTRLVNDLLEQARLEQGNFHLNQTEFSLADQLEKLHSQMASRAQAKRLDFTVWIDPALPSLVYGDPLRLYQILDNLVENAIKYTDMGSVGVRVCPADNGQVAFEVRDTGVGIPRDVQSVIYDAFQQVRAGRSEQDQGFGLGLSIVKQLTTLMNGEIDLHSEIGKGSTFTVRLPLAPLKETTS